MTRRPIPKGRTMDVVAAHLKGLKNVNPILIEEFEKIAAEYKGRDRVFDQFKEGKRIEAQRTRFAMIPDSTAKDRFKDTVINRAWELLDIGACDACDALLEFVPSADAEKMLSEYFAEDVA